MLKFAVVASALSADAREAAGLARELGFSGLQFDAYSPALRIPELSGTGRREFLRVLAGQNQELVGLRVDAGPKGFGPGADVDRMLGGLDLVMEAAKALAAPLICMDLGPLPEPPKVAKPKPKVTAKQAGLILLPESFEPATEDVDDASPPADPAFVAQVDAALADAAARADRYGVMLALRSDLSSFAALDEVLRRVRCPWFGVDFDPAAALVDAWPMDEIFSRLGASIRHVRARDALKGTNRGRTKPAMVGQGDISWGELLANLDGAGYAGWISIDPVELTDRMAAAAQAMKYLASLADRRV